MNLRQMLEGRLHEAMVAAGAPAECPAMVAPSGRPVKAVDGGAPWMAVSPTNVALAKLFHADQALAAVLDQVAGATADSKPDA